MWPLYTIVTTLEPPWVAIRVVEGWLADQGGRGVVDQPGWLRGGWIDYPGSTLVDHPGSTLVILTTLVQPWVESNRATMGNQKPTVFYTKFVRFPRSTLQLMEKTVGDHKDRQAGP